MLLVIMLSFCRISRLKDNGNWTTWYIADPLNFGDQVFPSPILLNCASPSLVSLGMPAVAAMQEVSYFENDWFANEA